MVRVFDSILLCIYAEVSKALKARKLEKMRKMQSESLNEQIQQLTRVDHSIEDGQEAGRIESERTIHHHQVMIRAPLC